DVASPVSSRHGGVPSPGSAPTWGQLAILLPISVRRSLLRPPAGPRPRRRGRSARKLCSVRRIFTLYAQLSSAINGSSVLLPCAARPPPAHPAAAVPARRPRPAAGTRDRERAGHGRRPWPAPQPVLTASHSPSHKRHP